jgi:glycosyl transferase family 25
VDVGRGWELGHDGSDALHSALDAAERRAAGADPTSMVVSDRTTGSDQPRADVGKARFRPPIWVISLERSAARRMSVCHSLAAVGLEFEVIDAVDGSTLTDAQQRRHSRRRAVFERGRGLSAGELGTALSHLGAYERMIAEKMPVALIIEDDVLASPDLPKVLDGLATLPSGWDVITLHSLFASSTPVPIDGRMIAGRFRLCKYERLPYGAQAYLIRDAAAARLLGVSSRVFLPADDLLFRTRPAGLRVFGIEPRVVDTANFSSEIGALETPSDLHLSVLDRSVAIAGKVWRRIRPPFA